MVAKEHLTHPLLFGAFVGHILICDSIPKEVHGQPVAGVNFPLQCHEAQGRATQCVTPWPQRGSHAVERGRTGRRAFCCGAK